VAALKVSLYGHWLDINNLRLCTEKKPKALKASQVTSYLSATIHFGVRSRLFDLNYLEYKLSHGLLKRQVAWPSKLVGLFV